MADKGTAMVMAFSLQSYVCLLLLSSKLKQVESNVSVWDTNVNYGARETRSLANNRKIGRKVSRTSLAAKDTQGIMGVPLARSRFHGRGRGACTYILLGEVYEVLQVNVVSVRPDVVVNKEIQLVFDPVFENKRQHPSSELQEENNPQEHRKLRGKKHTTGNGHRG